MLHILHTTLRANMNQLNNINEQNNADITLDSFLCSRCGCKGLHACIGEKIEWTEHDQVGLKMALGNMFGWENNTVIATFKVRKFNYVPEYVSVQQRIDALTFIGSFSSQHYPKIHKNVNIEHHALKEIVGSKSEDS